MNYRSKVWRDGYDDIQKRLLTFDVSVRSVGDVAVHEIGRGDRANVARERRQVWVAGVGENVVLRGDDRKGRERHVHLHAFRSFRVRVKAAVY